jgi:hypothetical protein
MEKEFMLYIRNAGDAKGALSAEEHLEFIKKCEIYIEQLKTHGKLIAAQPLVREGIVLSKINEEWNKQPINLYHEIQVGYYHIMADDIDDAIEIAKDNPEFEYIPSASIEIRPIKMKEEDTNFVYPK